MLLWVALSFFHKNISFPFLARPKAHEDLIFNAPGGIGCQTRPFGRVKGGDPLDQPNGANGYQILLIRRLGVVFLGGLMPVKTF